MKIAEYNDMMAYLTRQNFNGGGSGKKPITIKDLKDSGKIVTGDKYKPSNPKLIQAIRDFELRNPRKKNDEGGPQIVEPPKSMQMDTTTSNPVPEYDINDFRNDAEIYVLMLHNNTIPRTDIADKLNSFAQKGIDAGTFTMQEAADTVKDLKLYIKDRARQQRLRDIVPSGIGTIKRKEFSKGGVSEYLSTLEPGSVINTYELGKKFNVAPATVRGQVERNFPELKLQTAEESAVKAAEKRKELYKKRTSDLPIIETKIRGKGKEAKTKGRDVVGIRWPNEEMEENYIKDLKEKYSGKLGEKGLTNPQLAEKYFGSSSVADVSRVERINNFLTKDLNLKFKKGDPNIVKEKRTRRLAITQGGKTFTGTDQIPFHHIMPIGGEVDLTTKDVAFINKQMNSKLAPYNTKLNDIADAISNQLNNQEPGYLNRIDELNNQAGQIIESVKLRLPKKYQNYIGFNRLDPITDEYGTPIRMNVTRVGVDDSKSLAGKTGQAQKLETLTQKSLMDQIKDLNIKIPKSELLQLGSKLPGPFKLLKGFEDGGIVSRQNLGRGYLAGGIKSLGKKYKGSTLEAILENPKLMGAEMGYEGIAEILRLFGLYSVGGRVGFADGPEDPSKRKFMKIMGGLASLPILGKFFKIGEKAAPVVQNIFTKIEKLKNTKTLMPDWFPSFVDKFRKEGKAENMFRKERIEVSKAEYDQAVAEGKNQNYFHDAARTEEYKANNPDYKEYYKVEDTDELIGTTYTNDKFPGVEIDDFDGEVQVNWQNDYSQPVNITYVKPGAKGPDLGRPDKVQAEIAEQEIKREGEFSAMDQEVYATDPDGGFDTEEVIVDTLDDMMEGTTRQMEEYATGKKVKNLSRGEGKVIEAEVRAGQMAKDTDATYEGDPINLIDDRDYSDAGFDD